MEISTILINDYYSFLFTGISIFIVFIIDFFIIEIIKKVLISIILMCIKSELKKIFCQKINNGNWIFKCLSFNKENNT